jgi:hypothetical protein
MNLLGSWAFSTSTNQQERAQTWSSEGKEDENGQVFCLLDSSHHEGAAGTMVRKKGFFWFDYGLSYATYISPEMGLQL